MVNPFLTGLCAGYELGKWRSDPLASHLMEWLPEFALKEAEWKDIDHATCVRQLARAALVVYKKKDPHMRGEIGELMLHVALRQICDTIPAISKYYYKDSSNDTVKGFDAVHVVATETTLQLWLGESKFYTDIAPAIRDAISSVKAHLEREYLRSEFLLVMNKIDDNWPHAARLKKLLDPNTSLDQVFDSVCIPAFLAYNSPVVAQHSSVTDQFKADFEQEVRTHYQEFAAKATGISVQLHAFLFPMLSKSQLIDDFDKRLKACQNII
jgi:hypothetical protein